MSLLPLSLVALSGLVELGGSGAKQCVDIDEVERRLSRSLDPLQLASVEVRIQAKLVEQRVELQVFMSARGERSERRFDLSRADCPYVPGLVELLIRRFVQALPPPRGLTMPAELRPGWFERTEVGLQLGFSTASEAGVRASLGRGAWMGSHWTAAVHFDRSLEAALGAESADLWGLRVGAGLGWERVVGGFALRLDGLALAGAQWALSAGRNAVLPDARVRVELRSRWPNALWLDAAVTVGLALEAGVIRPVFRRGSAQIEAPIARAELLVGMSFGWLN